MVIKFEWTTHAHLHSLYANVSLLLHQSLSQSTFGSIGLNDFMRTMSRILVLQWWTTPFRHWSRTNSIMNTFAFAPGNWVSSEWALSKARNGSKLEFDKTERPGIDRGQKLPDMHTPNAISETLVDKKDFPGNDTYLWEISPIVSPIG